jgi:hypothetical protein
MTAARWLEPVTWRTWNQFRRGLSLEVTQRRCRVDGNAHSGRTPRPVPEEEAKHKVQAQGDDTADG